MVVGLRKASALMVPPMDSPRRRVTTFASSFWAASESRLTTPLSRIRFPNIRVPMRRVPWGARMLETRNTAIGKRTRTARGSSSEGDGILIFRSRSDVRNLDRGTWSSGTRDMYV
jgi:hypothetical protein